MLQDMRNRLGGYDAAESVLPANKTDRFDNPKGGCSRLIGRRGMAESLGTIAAT